MTSLLLEPLPSGEWNVRLARHLLRRAGFGYPIYRAEELARQGPEAAVAAFVDYENLPFDFPEPDWLDEPQTYRQMRADLRQEFRRRLEAGELSEAEQQALQRERQRLFNELMRERRQDIERLKVWWVRRMLRTPRPLEEKLALFWHGHFATSAQKVRSPWLNYHLNDIFRRHAAGNFKTLTSEVGRSPAMLIYLDGVQNTRRSPNENWARELMELFTMGIGHYTEADIKEAARAFTGWSFDGERFVFHRFAHDDGEKIFMGRRGRWTGLDVIGIIFEQPATAEFISRKLWTHFAYDEPEPEIVEGLAATLRESDYDLKPLLRRMFLSRAFYGERAIGNQIKSPVQLAVGMAAQLGIEPDDTIGRLLAFQLRTMGQDLFYPPNVKGWDGGRAWINTNTLLHRYNLANLLVNGILADPPPGAPRLLRQAMEEDPEFRFMVNRSRLTPGDDGSGPLMRATPRRPLAAMEGDPSAGAIQFARAPFQPDKFFRPAQGYTLPQIADFLADFFYPQPLRADQRDEIVEALAGDRQSVERLDLGRWDQDRLRSAVRLMLSAAEYQLC